MKIIHKYILRQVSIVFIVCLVVFTFVLFIGNMLRIIEMMAKGVGMTVILRFLAFLVPFMLSYSIPISILTSVLLVFARLSADNEITAIRASGVNLRFIINPLIICTIILASLCYFINDRLRPNAIFSGRRLLLKIGMQEPMIRITSGRFNEVFPNYVLYVGQKSGRVLRRVVVYKFEQDRLNSVITAESGELQNKEKGVVLLRLSNGVIEEISKEEQATGKLNRMQFETYNIEFNIDEQLQDVNRLAKKEREMTNSELKGRIDHLRYKLSHPEYIGLNPKLEQEISSIKTRIHNRLAMSFSCLVFILVGIPLGIKVHRSETSIGAGISLILVSFYYFLMTLGEAFQDRPNLYPWLLMWVPNLLIFIVGMILIHKLLKR